MTEQQHPILRITPAVELPPGAEVPTTSAAAVMAGAPTPHPTAANPPMSLDDTARHLAALAEEPYGLDRIRAILIAREQAAEDATNERWREWIRTAAQQRADLSEQRAKVAATYLPHNPSGTVAEVTWAASLADQAAALRSLL